MPFFVCCFCSSLPMETAMSFTPAASNTGFTSRRSCMASSQLRRRVVVCAAPPRQQQQQQVDTCATTRGEALTEEEARAGVRELFFFFFCSPTAKDKSQSDATRMGVILLLHAHTLKPSPGYTVSHFSCVMVHRGFVFARFFFV